MGAKFGIDAGKALRVYKNEQTVPAANTALTAPGRFSHGARVITVAFDFWDNPDIGDGSVVLRAGTGSVANASRVHEVQFRKGTLSGVGGVYQAGQPARVEVVMNNSTDAVVYAEGAATVASDTFDVWINGIEVLDDHAWNRGSLPVGSLLTGLQFASFSSSRAEVLVRDLRVYEGAAVTPAEDDSGTLELFLAPDGSDANNGLSLAAPILTVARAQEIIGAEGHPGDVRIRIAPGRYHGQTVVWTYARAGRRIVFEALDPEAPLPVFDGCSKAGECSGGTWFRLNFSAGRHTNLEFRHLRFENYQTAISFNGNRNSENGFNGGNVIYGCSFYRIGNVFNPELAPSTAVIRLVNSRENIIENNDFVDAINVTGGVLLHAVYVAHLSGGNFILQNRFIDHSGDAVRVRDFSNDNVILDNIFLRAGADGYSEWYCDQDVRDDCTKPTPECPSWGNEFRDNRLVSGFEGGSLGTFQFHQDDTTSGCSPTEDAVRLRTSGNFRDSPGQIDLWRHRYFTFEERADSSVAGDQAKPTGDGVANLLKYAMGLDPRRPVRKGELATVDVEGARLGIRYWRNQAATDVELVIEISSDLKTWEPLRAEPVAGEPVAGRTPMEVSGVEPHDDSRVFLRLTASRLE